MLDLAPETFELDPIEVASRDQIAALQLERLKQTLPHADADETPREAGGASLGHHIKSSIGVSADVSVVEPGGVERSMGKAKRVVDLGPKD